MLFWGSPNLPFPYPSILECWPGDAGAPAAVTPSLTGLGLGFSKQARSTVRDSQGAFETEAGVGHGSPQGPFSGAFSCSGLPTLNLSFPANPTLIPVKFPCAGLWRYRGWGYSQREAGPEDRPKPVWLLAIAWGTPQTPRTQVSGPGVRPSQHP